MLKNNQKGAIHIVVIGLVVVAIIAGITTFIVLNNDDGDLSVDESSSSPQTDNPIEDQGQTSSDYPDLYKQYGLPEYPNATITDDGRTQDNLDDGISLTLTTDDEVQAVGQFYADAFADLDGWNYTPPNYSNNNLYGSTASKSDEDLTYQLSVTNLSDTVQIKINFLRN